MDGGLSVPKRKRDEGIATLANGVRIPEATRDILLKRDWNAGPKPREGLNPDTATTQELEAARFSGFRINEFTQDLELWCLGSIKVKRKTIEATPQVIANMHEEAFATAGSLFSFDADGVRKASANPRKKRS